MRFAYKFAPILLLSTALQAQDLTSIVKTAVETHPNILAQQETRNAADARIDQERAAYLPRLDLSANTGWSHIHRNTKRNQLNSEAKGSSVGDRQEATVTLRQNIFDGLEGYYRMQKAEYDTEQASRNVVEAQFQIAYDAARSYIDIRRFERLIKLGEENIAVHKQILKKVQEQVRAGKATTADENVVASRLFDSQAAVEDIRGDHGSAVARFIATTGMEPDKLERISIDYAKVPATIDAAVESTKTSNPTVRAAKAAVKAADANLDSTVGTFLPKVDFEVNRRRAIDVNGAKGTDTNTTALFTANFNVSNGGRDLARRKELRSTLGSAKYKLENEYRRTAQEARISYAELNSAKGQAIALRNAVGTKKKVRDTYLEQFNAGTVSYIQILEASHDYFLAKGSLITADAAEDASAMRLMAITGDLFKYFDIVEKDA